MLSFVKKHGVLVIAILSFAAAAYFKYQQVSVADELAKQAAVHAEELKKINEARQQEAELHKKNEEALRDALNKVEQEYIAAQVAIKQKKKDVAGKIITDTANDPGKLADELSKATGIKVVR